MHPADGVPSLAMFARPNSTSEASARIRLGEHAQVFSTRARAEEIRGEIERAARASSVLLDFEGVRSISFSFADELFGVLAERHAREASRVRPVAIGLTAQVQRVLLGTLEARGVPESTWRELVPH
jgi:hypothetical protein